MSQDYDGLIAAMERQWLAVFSLPGPLFLRLETALPCPACGMTRGRCLATFGRDPVHEEDKRRAVEAGKPREPQGP